MTKTEWLLQVKENVVVLRSLIQSYHPATPDGPQHSIGPITAGLAEKACEVVRSEIAVKEADKGNPTERFDTALAAEDVSKIYSLLSSAWFGVPESTSCWSIPGFKEAVDLMDDPPEED